MQLKHINWKLWLELIGIGLDIAQILIAIFHWYGWQSARVQGLKSPGLPFHAVIASYCPTFFHDPLHRSLNTPVFRFKRNRHQCPSFLHTLWYVGVSSRLKVNPPFATASLYAELNWLANRSNSFIVIAISMLINVSVKILGAIFYTQSNLF